MLVVAALSEDTDQEVHTKNDEISNEVMLDVLLVVGISFDPEATLLMLPSKYLSRQGNEQRELPFAKTKLETASRRRRGGPRLGVSCGPPAGGSACCRR